MELTLARHWWMLVLRGVLAALFGVLAFVYPGEAFLALAWVIGAYFLVDGVFAVAAAVTGHAPGGRWGTFLLEGLLGVVAGVIAFAAPDVFGLGLLYVIAVWAVVTGVVEIVAAVRLRKHIEGELLLGLAGVLSILFGVLIALNPFFGAVVVTTLIGAYAVLFGATLIALGFRLRGRAYPGRTATPAAV